MADIFDVGDVVGHSLIAKKTVTAYTNTSKSVVVGTFKSGQTVGVVTSWAGGTASVPAIFWEFYGEGNKPYYVEHAAGRYDVGALKAQGVKTVQQNTDAKNAPKGVIESYMAGDGGGVVNAAFSNVGGLVSGALDVVKTYALWGLLIAGGVVTLYVVVKKVT